MLKCRISLDAFVWELTESNVDSGKGLYVEDKLNDLDNIGQGVWTALVSEGEEQYEIELLVKSRVFQKVGCECALFGAGSICPHIVAGFFAVLEKLPKKALRNEPILAIPLAKRKVRDFIQMLPEERMEDVLVNFARKNRRFALVLRAAATPHAIDEIDKYKDILYMAIKHATTTKKISVSGLGFFNEITFSIMTELKVMLSTGETAEIRLFADAFFKVWPSLKNYELPDSKRTVLALNQVLTLLENSMAIIVAPAVLEDVVIKLAAHVPIYARVEPDFAHKLIRLLKKWAKDRSMQDQCAEMILPFLDHELTYTEMHPVLELLVSWGRSPALLIPDAWALWDEVAWLAYCQLAIDSGHFELLAALVNKIKEGDVSVTLLSTLSDFELIIAKSVGDDSRLVSLAENSFKATGKVKYYKILKEYYQEDWVKEAKRLHSFFVNEAKPLPAALMLVDLKDWDALIELTKQQEDLLFLSKVDKYLFKHREKITMELYNELLIQYFDTHLGGKPADIYLFLLKHLKDIGYGKFAKEISGWMLKRYGHRPLLKSVI